MKLAATKRTSLDLGEGGVLEEGETLRNMLVTLEIRTTMFKMGTLPG